VKEDKLFTFFTTNPAKIHEFFRLNKNSVNPCLKKQRNQRNLRLKILCGLRVLRGKSIDNPKPPSFTINSANISRAKNGIKTSKNSRVFSNFLFKRAHFLLKKAHFLVLFEAFLNAKFIFSLPPIAHITHIRQFGRYVTFISAFSSKVFGVFGQMISFL
jgi:hypothetical protein